MLDGLDLRDVDVADLPPIGGAQDHDPVGEAGVEPLPVLAQLEAADCAGEGPALAWRPRAGERRAAEREQALLAERGYTALVAPTLGRAACEQAIGLATPLLAGARS